MNPTANRNTPSPYDILLIHAHRDYYFAAADGIAIGTLLLASVLRDRGLRVGYFRGFAGETAGWLRAELEATGARCVGFYCDYENVTLVESLSRMVKSGGEIPVVVGGPQAFALTEEFFERSRCDFAIRGEAERTLPELLEHLLEGKGCREAIDGISYPDGGGRLVRNRDRELIANLDELPFADFRLERRWPYQKSLPVLSGRGCPYRCAFCFEGGNTRTVRYRSVGHVMAEIRENLNRRPDLRSVFFLDDTFTLNRQRVEEFCRELSQLRRQHDFVWFCEGHVQTINRHPDLLPVMVAAGLVKMAIGIESGCDETLRLYNKQSSAAEIEAAVGRLVRAGVPQVEGNIILGGPQETKQTARASLNLVLRLLRAHPGKFFSGAYFLTPFPGTAITCAPERFGLKFLPPRVKSGLDDIPQAETEALSIARLFEIRRSFVRRVHSAMSRILHSGKVPHDSMTSAYRLAARYGIASRWLQNLTGRVPVTDRYFSLLARGGAVSSRGIRRGRLMKMHPMRTFEVWNSIRFSEGYPVIQGFALSPLEYDLLCASSGKRPLGEILQSAFRKFGSSSGDYSEFEKLSMGRLKAFEKKHWLAYSEF